MGALLGQHNVTHVVIGKDLDYPTTTTRQDLATGEIAVYKIGENSSAAISALAATDKVSIAYKKTDGYVFETPIFEVGNLMKKVSKDTTGSAGVLEQIHYVGYDGTSGSIAVNDSSVYLIDIILNNNGASYNPYPLHKYGSYESGSSATQQQIANGLIKNLVKNFSRVEEDLIDFNLISNGTQADWTGVATHMLVTSGSKSVIYTDGLGAAAAGEALADGQLVGIAGATYVVEGAGTTAGFTISVPYIGATAEVAGGTTYATQSGLLSSVTAFGIKMTGKPMEFKTGIYSYDKFSFQVGLNTPFTGTKNETTQNPAKGLGAYEEVAENEWFCKGFRGEPNRIATTRPVDFVADAVSGKYYDNITLKWKEDSTIGIDAARNSYGSVLIYTEDQSSGNIYASLKTIFGL